MVLPKGVMPDSARFCIKILPEGVEIFIQTEPDLASWQRITHTFAAYCCQARKVVSDISISQKTWYKQVIIASIIKKITHLM